MKRIQSGHAALVLELQLDLAVVAPDEPLAHRAEKTDTGAAPGPIGAAGRHSARSDRFVRLTRRLASSSIGWLRARRSSPDTGVHSGGKVKPDARGRVTRVNQRARWKAGAVYRTRLTPSHLKRRHDPGVSYGPAHGSSVRVTLCRLIVTPRSGLRRAASIVKAPAGKVPAGSTKRKERDGLAHARPERLLDVAPEDRHDRAVGHPRACLQLHDRRSVGIVDAHRNGQRVARIARGAAEREDGDGGRGTAAATSRATNRETPLRVSNRIVRGAATSKAGGFGTSER